MRTSLYAAAMLSIALLLGNTAGAAEVKGSKMNEQFIRDAAQGDMLEMRLGEIAQQKAASPEVKEFAQRMQQDHSAHLEKVRGLAAGNNIKLSNELDSKHRSEVDKYAKMNGKDFDRQYMTHMVQDHQKDIKEYEKAQQQVTNPDEKALASETLPILKDHLSMAQNTQKSLHASK